MANFSTAVRYRWVDQCDQPWNMPDPDRAALLSDGRSNTSVVRNRRGIPPMPAAVLSEVLEDKPGIPRAVQRHPFSRERVQEMGDEMIENPLGQGHLPSSSNPLWSPDRRQAARNLKKCCVDWRQRQPESSGRRELTVPPDARVSAASMQSRARILHERRKGAGARINNATPIPAPVRGPWLKRETGDSKTRAM